MSKKLIAISIAAIMIGLFSTAALAGVEGSFDFDISLQPQTTTAEVSAFDIDFEGLLDLNIDLSGLTFSNDLAFGVAGIEHYVTDLTTTLGALTLNDEFWFATPYIASGEDVIPIGDLMFVKKRVDLQMTLAGLNLDTLILFEDINFPAPTDTAPTTYTTTDQNFAFGGIFTLSGETVSGIGVETITGINADPDATNAIKKYSASGAVQTGSIQFTVEKINITDIPVGPITLDNSLEFRPNTSIASTLTAKYSLWDFDVSATLDYDNITSLSVKSASFTLASDPFTVVLSDVDGDLALSKDDIIHTSLSLDIQSLTLSADLYTMVGTGFYAGSAGYAAEFVASLPLDGTTFTATADYDATTGGKLSFDTIKYELDTTINDLRFNANATFSLSGLQKAGLGFGVDFAV